MEFAVAVLANALRVYRLPSHIGTQACIAEGASSIARGRGPVSYMTLFTACREVGPETSRTVIARTTEENRYERGKAKGAEQKQ